MSNSLDEMARYLEKKKFLFTLDKPTSKLYSPLENLHFKKTTEIKVPEKNR